MVLVILVVSRGIESLFPYHLQSDSHKHHFFEGEITRVGLSRLLLAISRNSGVPRTTRS